MEKYNLEQTGQQVQKILNEATPQSELTAETERAQLAEQQLQNDIDAIEEKIPSGASSSNKLATEEYVDDSVSTATATFRGTFNLVSDLGLTVDSTEQQIAAALASEISTADNNDYCFVQIPTSAETPTEIEEIDRYKFNGTAWSFEYELNNSGFTADQWDAINSHITSGDVAKLLALPTNAELTILLNGKQDVLTFDNVPTENSNNPVKSGGVYSAIDDEKGARLNGDADLQQSIDGINGKIPSDASSENKLATASDVDDEATARSNADQSLQDAIEAILLLIPTAASSLNQLADKAFVNSSIATNTATFRGTFNLVNDLHLTLAATHAQVGNALALAILDSDNNDYCFVQIPTVETAPTEIAQTDRYKFNGSTWEYEYTLNNSGFTSAQWNAINSGITSALVTKLSALPTNSELTTDLGTLTSAITAINQKIPAAAAQNNKLVDTAALESYIVQVLGVLTISYNVTSTDGHVTLAIQQTDGKITSVSLTTSDIASAAALNLKASQADLTALASRVTTAEGNITTLSGRVSTNETDIAQLQAAYEALTQSDIIIGALPSSGVANKIYRVPGTNSYSDYMWNGTQFVLMATYNNAVDPRPKKGSTNLVESGGVFDNMGALDISELNATENPHTLATYADLSAALAAIPSNDYKKGGMSVKFVQTDDNKYVQYRLMSDTFNTTETNWQGVDDKPTPLSDNLVKSNGIAESINYINQISHDAKVVGAWINNDGKITTGGSSAQIVYKINVLEGESYKITNASIYSGFPYYYWSVLDENGDSILKSIKGINGDSYSLNDYLEIPSGGKILLVNEYVVVSSPTFFRVNSVKDVLVKNTQKTNEIESGLYDRTKKLTPSETLTYSIIDATTCLPVTVGGSDTNWVVLKFNLTNISKVNVRNLSIDDYHNGRLWSIIDSSNVVLSASAITSTGNKTLANADIDIPDNAAYLYIAYYKLKSIGEAYEYIKTSQDVIELIGTVEELEDDIKEVSLTDLNVASTFVYGFINNDGEIYTPQSVATSQSVHKINVSEGEIYKILNASIYSGFPYYYWSVLDENGDSVLKSVKGAISGGYCLTKDIVTIPQGGVMLIINQYTPEGVPSFFLEVLTNKEVSEINDTLTSEEIIKYPFKGKKFFCIGDSYTMQASGSGYDTHYMKSLEVTTKMIHGGDNGQTGNGLPLTYMAKQVLITPNIQNADIITILAGTNDYNHGSDTLGSWDDAEDLSVQDIANDVRPSTIYSAVRAIVKCCNYVAPHAKVIFFTQPERGICNGTPANTTPPGPNRNGLTMENIAKAIKDCANNLGSPCCDLHSMLWMFSQISFYTTDNLHPTADASYKMGRLMGKYINSLVDLE